ESHRRAFAKDPVAAVEIGVGGENALRFLVQCASVAARPLPDGKRQRVEVDGWNMVGDPGGACERASGEDHEGRNERAALRAHAAATPSMAEAGGATGVSSR